MRKCKYTKGCQNEAIWAMQFIGEDKPSFYALGWHIRGFKVTPVCDECFNKENDRQEALFRESESQLTRRAVDLAVRGAPCEECKGVVFHSSACSVPTRQTTNA